MKFIDMLFAVAALPPELAHGAAHAIPRLALAKRGDCPFKHSSSSATSDLPTTTTTTTATTVVGNAPTTVYLTVTVTSTSQPVVNTTDSDLNRPSPQKGQQDPVHRPSDLPPANQPPTPQTTITTSTCPFATATATSNSNQQSHGLPPASSSGDKPPCPKDGEQKKVRQKKQNNNNILADQGCSCFETKWWTNGDGNVIDGYFATPNHLYFRSTCQDVNQQPVNTTLDLEKAVHFESGKLAWVDPDQSPESVHWEPISSAEDCKTDKRIVKCNLPGQEPSTLDCGANARVGSDGRLKFVYGR